MSDSVRMKDFTKKKKVVQFVFDGEVYRCYPGLAPEGLQELIKYADDITPQNALASLDGFFGIVMNEENARKIQLKLRDKESPLEIDVATDMMLWILEEFGLRPTQSSPDSSTGSPTGGDGSPSEAGA